MSRCQMQAFVAHKEEDDGSANPKTRRTVHSQLEADSADLSTVWWSPVDCVLYWIPAAPTHIHPL
jgi:hypothetical protein